MICGVLRVIAPIALIVIVGKLAVGNVLILIHIPALDEIIVRILWTNIQHPFLDVTGRYSKRLNYRSPYPLARFGECLF